MRLLYLRQQQRDLLLLAVQADDLLHHVDELAVVLLLQDDFLVDRQTRVLETRVLDLQPALLVFLAQGVTHAI